MLALVPLCAAAQSGQGAAEALFNAARAAAQRGDHAEACARFRESQRLDPATGTLLNIADCAERLGQYVSAWESYMEALRLLPSDDRRTPYAHKKLGEIEARLAWLSVRLVADAPANTTVVVAGIDLNRASIGVEFPVDPGDVALAVHADDHLPMIYALRLAEGEHRELTLGPGEELIRPPTLAGSLTTSLGFGPGRGETPRLRTATWIAFGAAGAGLVTGAATGIAAVALRGALAGECTGNRCPTALRSDVNRYDTLRTASVIGFIVGGAGLAAGVSTLVFAPSARNEGRPRASGPRILPWIGPTSGGVGGAF